jgi:hypothetical protein
MNNARVTTLERERDDARRAASDRAVVLDDLVAAVKLFKESIGTASDVDINTAERKLDKAIADAEQLRAKYPLPTLKLSGIMVDATDRDLVGNPTLEGDCRA